MENNNKLSPQNQANNIDEDLVDPRDMQPNIELDLWLDEDVPQQPTTPPDNTPPPPEHPKGQGLPQPRHKREKVLPLFDQADDKPKHNSIYMENL